MAALTIFGVAIVGIVEGLGAAIAIQSDLSMTRRASMLAGNVLEEIQYSKTLDEGDQSGQYEGTDAAFAWRTVTEPTAIDGLYQVMVTISWGTAGHEKDYSLTTMIYSAGGASETSNQKSQPANRAKSRESNSGAGGGSGVTSNR